MVTLNLTVNNPAVVITASAETVCAGTNVTLTASGTDSYLWSTGATTSSITVTPTATTTYSVTGYDNNSCEATAAITITVNEATSETINASICEGESYDFYGQILTAAGTYTYETTNANGCLHVVTLNLTVYEVEDQTIDATICEGETYTENGFNVSIAGTYTRTETNANGCEYTITLILTVNPTTYETIDETICEGDSFEYNDVTYTEAGTYTINTINEYGCLHVVTLNLTVNPVTSNTTTVTICDNETYEFYGTVYNIGGTYTYVTENTYGCTHTEILVLTVNPTTSETINASICEGESYEYNGETYTEAGTYTITTTNEYGCAHVVTLNLTVTTCGTGTCPLPENVTATYSEPALTLTWDAPGTNDGEWITWSDDEQYTAIGTNSASTFIVAQRFETSDLTAYDGMQLTRMSFVPNERNCTYTVKI